MYEKQLKELGLTEGESKVYESLLFIGSSTVGPIVKKSGVAYSNIYEILNRLSEKGLVSFIRKEKTKYFQAVQPTRIRDYLDKQEQKIHKNRTVFEKLLPELEHLTENAMKKEEAEIFIGEKGLLTAYEILLKNSRPKDAGFFFYVYEPKLYEKSENFYRKSWNVVKKYKTIWMGVSNKKFKETHLRKKSPHFIKYKFVNFPLPGNIDIFQDKVLLVSWLDKPIGILIHSQDIADNFKHYFESVWKSAKF